MAFKTITLTNSRWDSICQRLESSEDEHDKDSAAMIREQLSGDVTVKVSSKSATFKVSKGGDLRDTAVAKKL
jgi:hypothetical protein